MVFFIAHEDYKNLKSMVLFNKNCGSVLGLTTGTGFTDHRRFRSKLDRDSMIWCSIRIRNPKLGSGFKGKK
jgi:hypothetical protein